MIIIDFHLSYNLKKKIEMETQIFVCNSSHFIRRYESMIIITYSLSEVT